VLLEVDGLPIANDGSCTMYGRRLALICTPSLPLTLSPSLPPL
jgi:hypothetical protein